MKGSKSLAVFSSVAVLLSCSTCPTSGDQVKPNGQYSYCDMRGFSFKSMNLEGSNLSYCDLRGSDFRITDLDRTDFRGSNLSNSNFFGASGTAFFYNSNLSNSTWVKGQKCLSNSIGSCNVRSGGF